MTLPLVLPQTLTAGTPQNVNDLNSNLNAIVTEFNAAVPQCRVTHNTTQSIPTATYTAIQFNTEAFDTGTPSSNMHDTVTNNSRLTCRVAGLYLITGNIMFATATGTIRITEIYLNNTTAFNQSRPSHVASTTTPSVAMTTLLRLAVNDYVELRGYQDSGGALNTVANESSFCAVWLSA